MRLLVLCLLVLWLGFAKAGDLPCNLQEKQHGKVCVCTANYCDFLRNPQPRGVNEVNILSSTKEGLRFATTTTYFRNNSSIRIDDYGGSRFLSSLRNASRYLRLLSPISFRIPNIGPLIRYVFKPQEKKKPRLYVNRDKVYQKVLGFGGAFTGSVSDLLNDFPEPLRHLIYKSYFHDDGIAYNLMRISIGGSDFDAMPWAYNELPEDDPQLSNFTQLDERDEQKVEQIAELKRVANRENLKIMGAAWSPPPWMKSNKKWTGFSELLPKYYQTWADYHMRFLELMAAKNMPIWAISTGNEPLNGIIGWLFIRFMSLGWTPQNQAIWLAEHLGPTLRSSPFKDVLVFANDDQRYTYPAWFKKMNESRNSSLDFVDGFSVHWYWDEVFDPSLIDETVEEIPGKLLLSSESCLGDKPWEVHGPTLGSWERGERYARSIIQDFQHAFNGYLDWNIVLNEWGGPNYAKNYVDAPIILNTTSQREFYKQPMYYVIGHFSKFVPEGSVRIQADLEPSKLETLAFKRPDGRIVVILFNGETEPSSVILNDSVRGNLTIQMPPSSIHTVIYN